MNISKAIPLLFVSITYEDVQLDDQFFHILHVFIAQMPLSHPHIWN